MPPKLKHYYEFANFRFDVERKVLWRDDNIVELSPKAVEVLSLLVENHGNLIGREEILQKVWKDTFVEEGNLNHAISTLRKTLGETGIIQTVPRRGYRFAAQVQEVFNEDEPAELMIERHTLSHTVIGEVEKIQDEKLVPSKAIALPPPPASAKSKRAFPTLAIIAALLVAVIGLIWYFRSDLTRSSQATKTLAILPLQALNREDDDKAFGLGIVESLVSRLGSLEKLIVRPTNSVNRLAETENDPLEIGRKQKVDAVMTGSYQRADGRIRVTARLLKVSDGSQIWAGNFEENEANIFSLQDSLSAQVAKSLALNLTSHEKTILAKRYTENIDAYQAYLRGRFHFDKRAKRHFKLAVENYQAALSLDPNYALAYTGLADIYAMEAGTESDPTRRSQLYLQATEAAEQALALDEGLADTHASLGWIKRSYEWDWRGAERHFLRAIELNPNSVNAHQWYALLLVSLGRGEEAVREINKAIELDPLSALVHKNAITVFSLLSRYEDAFAALQKAAELDPESKMDMLFIKAGIYVQQGKYQTAIDETEANDPSQKMKDHSRTMAPLALAYLRTGQLEKAQDFIREMEKRVEQSGATGYYLAQLYANAGEEEKAVQLLERGYETRDDRMVFLKSEPSLEPLRNHARFQEILRKMHFTK